jgi:hypothetical protein
LSTTQLKPTKGIASPSGAAKKRDPPKSSSPQAGLLPKHLTQSSIQAVQPKSTNSFDGSAAGLGVGVAFGPGEDGDANFYDISAPGNDAAG